MARYRSVLLALAFAVGCETPPAAPTPPVVVAPAPAAASVEIDPTTARVGEVVTFTYRLSRLLDRAVDVWTVNTPPTGAPTEIAIDFPAGTTSRVNSTGYIPASWVGTWTKRLDGDRLPEGVILGEPSSGTWTVVP